METFIGSVILFAGNFAPRDWAYCDGSLQSIAQNTALFSILGTTYGGNGQTTFALPDLRGRVPVAPGQGPGLSNYSLGQMSGTESVTLLSTNLPAHTHALSVTAQVAVSDNTGNTDEAAGSFLANTNTPVYNSVQAPGGQLNGVSTNVQISNQGSNQPMSLMQPYLAINYIICLYGIYPSRN